MATAKSALVRLGALTDTDEGIAQTTDASGDDVTDTDDEDALPDDWDRVIWTDIGQKWSQQISCSGTDTKVAGWSTGIGTAPSPPMSAPR